MVKSNTQIYDTPYKGITLLPKSKYLLLVNKVLVIQMSKYSLLKKTQWHPPPIPQPQILC